VAVRFDAVLSPDTRADATLSIHRLQPPLAPREIFLLWVRGRTHSPLTARTIEIAVNVAAAMAEIPRHGTAAGGSAA
jgi:hypothetical protein